MKTVCWNCDGKGTILDDPCKTCHGTGINDEPRLHVMYRRKPFLGSRHPRGDKNTGWEKWPVLSAQVPPEVAVEIDRVGKKVANRHQMTKMSRASIVRSALLTWMEVNDPEPDAVLDGTAEEYILHKELEG